MVFFYSIRIVPVFILLPLTVVVIFTDVVYIRVSKKVKGWEWIVGKGEGQIEGGVRGVFFCFFIPI